MKKYIFFMLLIITFSSITTVSAAEPEAGLCTITAVSSDGKATGVLLDSSYRTALSLSAGSTLTITSDVPFFSLYIEWNSPVMEWDLSVNGRLVSCGQYGFLHEYISIDEGTSMAVINISSDMSISGIQAYTKGTLPESVQQWEPPCDRADILLYSSHADDELLFFGGIIPTYAGEYDLAVQVVYFSQYWNGDKIREHEKLDGLWTAGIKNYPIDLGYDDYYSETFEQAAAIYDYDTALEKTVEILRRFQPQVAVAQDFNGEYGHGTHMLTAKLMAEAVEYSMDESFSPETATLYGTWNVPKTYIHLYRENSIALDCRTPLEAFNGKTCLEVAKEAYQKHVSQQWCWFHVSDTSLYNCAQFGLYRTTVGNDTGNDIMENITPYAVLEETKTAQIREERRQALSRFMITAYHIFQAVIG